MIIGMPTVIRSVESDEHCWSILLEGVTNSECMDILKVKPLTD